MKYMDPTSRKKVTGICAQNFAFSFRDPLKPTLDTVLSELKSLSLFHIKTVSKPLFIFCVASGMTVSALKDQTLSL